MKFSSLSKNITWNKQDNENLLILREKYKDDVFLISKELRKSYNLCWNKINGSKLLKKWTDEEYLKLFYLHKTHNGNFLKISEELGRSPQSCGHKFRELQKESGHYERFQILWKDYDGNWRRIADEMGMTTVHIWRYIRKLKGSRDSQNSNNEKLISLVKLYGKNYKRIAVEMKLSPKNCRLKVANFEKKLDFKFINWSDYEKNRLIDLKSKFPKFNWRFISSLMNGRSPNACKKFYLEECDQISSWTGEEKKRLLDLKSNYPNGSWTFISEFMEERSPIECHDMWNKIVHDKTLNKGKSKQFWTEEEVNKLVQLREKYSRESWIFIANKMESRSWISCRDKYNKIVKKTNPEEIRKRWTSEEMIKLINLKTKYPQETWTFISSHMEGRSEKSCIFFWYSKCKKNITQSYWKKETIERLKFLRIKYPKESWAYISNLMDGPSAIDCESFWKGGCRNGNLWTNEEQSSLIHLKKTFPKERWSFISSLIYGRSAVACKRYWDDKAKGRAEISEPIVGFRVKK